MKISSRAIFILTAILVCAFVKNVFSEERIDSTLVSDLDVDQKSLNQVDLKK